MNLVAVSAYFRRPGADVALSLQQQQELILKMIDIIESVGSSLAAPIGILRMDPEKPPDTIATNTR
jgi:MscS family membrane protein